VKLSYVQINSKELLELVSIIEEAMSGYPNVHVSVACLVVAILAQNPSIAPETLQTCVKGLSEYMTTSIFGVKEGAVN
jgi:hypothetical protein